MNQYSVWLVPSKKDLDNLSHLIRDIASSQNSQTFVPHITIFGNIKKNKKSVINETKIIFADHRSATLKITNLNQSEDFFKTVFIEFEVSKFLQSAFLQLKNKFRDSTSYAEKPFKPHLSLIYKNLSEKKRISIINSLRLKKSYSFNQIYIASPRNVYRGWYDIKSWKLLRIAKLSKKQASKS